jgi:hypothetical protein
VRDTNVDDRPMTRTYVAVLVVEAAVLLVLWAAGRYFGSA